MTKMMAINDTETYHKFNNNYTIVPTRDLFTELKEKLIWGKEESILDVGCATGNVTVQVVKKFVPLNSKLTAIDISETMINCAKQLHSDSNVSFAVVDITDDNIWATLQREQFTKVVSFFTMYRIIECRKAYENMYNLLKPGGEMLLRSPIEHDMDQVFPELAKISKYNTYREELAKLKLHFYPQEDHITFTTDLLRSIGFEVTLCKKSCIKLLGDITDCVALIRISSPLSHILPKELFEEALQDCEEIIKSRNIMKSCNEGTYNLGVTIDVIARKPCQT